MKKEPREYKGKAVLHIPSGAKFTVSGGEKINGDWYLSDSDKNNYRFDECADLDQLEFDVRRLKDVNSLKKLEAFVNNRDRDRFQLAWDELEKEPAECAAVAILYCEGWEEFEGMCSAYGVDKNSPELNHKFRILLKVKGLDRFPVQWYKNHLCQPPQTQELEGISVGDRVVCAEYSDRVGTVTKINPQSELMPYHILIEKVAAYGTTRDQIEVEF